jgi:NAD(P)H-flavin reductase
MIEYLVDTKEKRDIVFFYACSSESEFVYKDIFSKAVKTLGITMVYVVTHEESVSKDWIRERGHITADMIKKYVDSPSEYAYYISGPNAMVEAYKGLLHTINISRKNIVTDYFPGF